MHGPAGCHRPYDFYSTATHTINLIEQVAHDTTMVRDDSQSLADLWFVLAR